MITFGAAGAGTQAGVPAHYSAAEAGLAVPLCREKGFPLLSAAWIPAALFTNVRRD